jgi:hypothetical protein
MTILRHAQANILGGMSSDMSRYYSPIYERVKDAFVEGNYEAVIAEYLRVEKAALFSSGWDKNVCKFYYALAYAYRNDYRNAVTMYRGYLASIPQLRPHLAHNICGSAFIAKLKQREPLPWLELWDQMRHEMAPIEALVEDLWHPDLPYDDDNDEREPIYEALKVYGADALPVLLNALALCDYNYESSDQEAPYHKRALVNIGTPAFDALAKAIFISGDDKMKATFALDASTQEAHRISRAAIKMLHMFGVERAEPVLRKALNDPAANYKDYIERELEWMDRKKSL